LFVAISVADHPLFEREDTNVICQLPISFAQAALGCELEVPTLDGPVSMKIPAGTQSGKTYRLRGKGIPSLQGYGRGDQMVIVKVETPINLNKRQKELLEEFATISGEDVHPLKKGFLDKVMDFLS
jgi:molecular chaperone DnaJ